MCITLEDHSHVSIIVVAFEQFYLEYSWPGMKTCTVEPTYNAI